MYKRVAIFFISVLALGTCSCKSDQDILTSSTEKSEHIFYSEDIDDADIYNRVHILEEQLGSLVQYNNELIDENKGLKAEIDKLRSDIGIIDVSLTGLENKIPSDIGLLASEMQILNINIQNLYKLGNYDSYNYLFYRIDKAFEYVTSFEDLMNLYSYNLDGIYTDNFSILLGDEYRKTDFHEFIDQISIYNDEVIDDLAGLLIYDIGYAEGIDQLKNDIDALDKDYESNYAIIRLKYYLENRFDN